MSSKLFGDLSKINSINSHKKGSVRSISKDKNSKNKKNLSKDKQKLFQEAQIEITILDVKMGNR